ncbi:snf5 [Anaeramoeba flamelloides]|uniref:Snf5 n=1 Tax=Anaeramoeba flamelloides TaxID=1746091 RepID=A0AAV8A1A6_9EUKA|nr:snf5 [Anaeramoeba flamelloides]
MNEAHEFTGYSVLDKLRTEFGEHEGSLFYGLGHDDPRSPFLFQSIVLNVDQQEDYNIPMNQEISGNENEKNNDSKEKEKENKKENEKENENENENEKENQIATRLGIKRLWDSKKKKTIFNCRTSRNNTSAKGLTSEMIAKRREAMKRIVDGFLQENILKREKGQCECIFDGKKFDSYKECVKHIKTNYKDQIIKTLRSMSTFDFEEEPLGDFLTKMSYINYIRPNVIERSYTLPAISGSSTVAPYLICHSEEEERILSQQAKNNPKYMYQNSPKPSLTENEICEIEKTLFGRVLTINKGESNKNKKDQKNKKRQQQNKKKNQNNKSLATSANNSNNNNKKDNKNSKAQNQRKGKANKNKNKKNVIQNKKETKESNNNPTSEDKLKNNEKENEQNSQKRNNKRKNNRRGGGGSQSNSKNSKSNQKKNVKAIDVKGMGLSKEIIEKSKIEIAEKLTEEIISSVVNSFCIKIVSKTVAQERKIYKKVLRKKEAIEKKKREKKEKIMKDFKNKTQNETAILLFEELKNQFLEKELNDLVNETIDEISKEKKEQEEIEKNKLKQKEKEQEKILIRQKQEREQVNLQKQQKQLHLEQQQQKHQNNHFLKDENQKFSNNNNNNNNLNPNLYPNNHNQNPNVNVNNPNINKQTNQFFQFLNQNRFSENKNYDSSNQLQKKQPDQNLKIPIHNMRSYPQYVDKNWNNQNGYYMNNYTNSFPQMGNMRPFDTLFGMVNDPFQKNINTNRGMPLYPNQKTQEQGLQSNQQNMTNEQKYYQNFDENNNRFLRNDFGYYGTDDFHKLGFESEYQPFFTKRTLEENEYFRQELINKENQLLQQQQQQQIEQKQRKQLDLKTEIQELIMLKSTPEEFGLNSDLCVVVSGINYQIKQKQLLVSFFKNCKVAIDKNNNTKIEFLYRTESRYCFVEFETKKDVENALRYDSSRLLNVFLRIFNPPKRKLKNIFTNKSGQKFVLNSKTKNAYFDVLMRSDSLESNESDNIVQDDNNVLKNKVNNTTSSSSSSSTINIKKDNLISLSNSSSFNLFKKDNLNLNKNDNSNFKNNSLTNNGWPTKFSIQKK